MRHFVRQRCARLALYATLARFALACGADTDRGPPIGSPTGPSGPVIHEAGSSATTGQAGNGANTGGSASVIISGGTFASGGDTFGASVNGSAGRDPFGVGGSSTAPDPFGIGGGPSAPFGGSAF